jgi:uncharacterized OsmC-like protein
MEGSQIGAALEKLGETYARQPERAWTRYSPAIATLDGGLKCRVAGAGGTEEIKTDMPMAMGGSASSPNPVWFFRASLASCCATVIAMRAARLGINLAKLEVAVEGEGDTRGILGLDDRISAGMSELRTTVQITADNAGAERLEELVRWSVEHSPVAATVREAPKHTVVVRTTKGPDSSFDVVVGNVQAG